MAKKMSRARTGARGDAFLCPSKSCSFTYRRPEELGKHLGGCVNFLQDITQLTNSEGCFSCIVPECIRRNKHSFNSININVFVKHFIDHVYERQQQHRSRGISSCSPAPKPSSSSSSSSSSSPSRRMEFDNDHDHDHDIDACDHDDNSDIDDIPVGWPADVRFDEKNNNDEDDMDGDSVDLEPRPYIQQ